MANQKRPITLLPGYLQTDTLKKVFGATVDHLFQESNIEFVNGYIGYKPAWYDRAKDVYVSEPDTDRTNYQLTPAAVSVDYLSGQITNAMFYDDLISQLRFQGADVSNHDRLFSQEYYSWSPPIDIDKFVNFGSYVWLPAGPNSIILLETTDLSSSIGQASYTYQGAYQLSSTGQTFSGTLSFVSGLKIKPTKDKNAAYNNKEFYVEGIGRSFILVPNEENFNPAWDIFAWDQDSWDGDPTLYDKQYVTIGRGSPDGNIWSFQNKWFHESVVAISQTYIVDQYTVQALRPIIEFDPGISLYNYGFYNRGIVDICDIGTGDILGSVVGKPSYTIQNVPLQDGMRILVTADIHPDVNNKIYTVSGVSQGAIQLTADTTGRDPTGAPVFGDRVQIRFGTSGLEAKNSYWDGVRWRFDGQQKTLNQPPLFNLYDVDGNSMSDPSIYPQSSFAGSYVFSYQTSDTAAIDVELGIPANLDQFGDFIFTNHLSTDQITYVIDNKFKTYVGDLSAYVDNAYEQLYVNGWWKSKDPSKQYIVNNYQLPQSVYKFQIDQTPADRTDGSLPNIFVTKISSTGDETVLIYNIDYTVNDRLVILKTAAQAGERVIIKTWNSKAPSSLTGYYEIPKNLSANPNNLPVTNVSRSQILQHFVEIIRNQNGFLGQGLGANNYKDSAQNRSFGLSILQHRAPLLKLALLNSISLSDITSNVSMTDPMLAMEYAQRSYTRFYNRFVQTLLNINSQVMLTGANTPDEWIDKALSIVNVAKTPSSPWANSGPTSLPGQYCSSEQTNPTYVPATPTRLGILPSYQPMVYFDNTYLTPKLTLQTHDGARIVLVDELGYELGTIKHDQLSTTNPNQLTNPVAAAWLQFELNLYNSLPSTYKDPDYLPVYDVRTESPGRWRSSAYSRNEYLTILRGAFDKWVITSQVDYASNTGYDTNNQFSFNYRSVNDTAGNPIPGHWQGIYRWYYDTDRPHTNPWEMLGFSIKPTWWDSEYGPAPYTSGNTAMWEDLRDGRIRQGARQGVDEQWARPGLMSCIPVDAQGYLLPPFFAGCAKDIPGVLDSQAEWIFGDGGPIESVWINSSDFKFSLAEAGYLLNPARFVEYQWDTLRTKEINNGTVNNQWIYIDTNSRRSSQQFYVHREQPISLNTGVTIPNESDLSYFGSCGFQHWVSEYLISNGFNVTNYLGNIIRGGDVKLGHRMAGFIPTDSFRALVDSFGQIGYNSRLIPNENINVHLYKSGSIGESVYSGVIIEQVKNGWKVRGYDSVDPSFIVIPSDPNGSKTNVVVGNQAVTEYTSGLNSTARVLYGTVFNTRQQIYDFLIGYGRWLQNQGWIFSSYDGLSNTVNDWSKSAKEFLFWSQGAWDNGTFITVSPSADAVTFAKQYGNIQYVSGIFSGTYPVLDRIGQPVLQNNLEVLRGQTSITVRAKNDQGIFLLRLFRNVLEHAVFFDNTTAFNDVIYQPLFDLQQSRILIYAYRAKQWDGRVDIPGYIIVQNTSSNTWALTSNFDKSADDLSRLFNIEEPTTYTPISPGPNSGVPTVTELGGVDTSNLSKLAKHNIGYQSRLYLQNLLLDDTTEFEFYQGFIRQKGSTSTINSLLRNNSIIPSGSTFKYFEEWLFRTGWYGGYDLNQVIEYILPQDKVNGDPQQVRLFGDQDSDIPNDYILDIVQNDPLIVTPPPNYQDPPFKLRTSYAINPLTDLPSAGYALLGEPKYYVLDQEALLSLYTNQLEINEFLAVGDTAWQFITPRGDWTVWRIDSALSQISNTIPSNTTGQPTIIVTNEPHGLIDGDICIIFGIGDVPEINDTFVISNVTSTSFSIGISTFQAGSGGTIWVYQQTRFADIFDRDSNTPPNGWVTGDIVYVDDGGIVPGAWTVYKYLQDTWLPIRQQQYKIDASLILSSELFDTVSKLKIGIVDYWDPAKGRISGIADAELTYKVDYDPAKYTNGNATGYAINPNEAWGNAQLGQVWWDLTTVRYIDYDQGDDTYKVANWGKLAPGTSVDVYEWVRSSVPPSDWASYVAQGTVISINGADIVPSGSVRNPDSPNWSEYVETSTDGTSGTYYYFWVKNSALTPFGDNRNLTTLEIASLIVSPNVGDVPWYAAISERSIILGNVSKYLNANTTMQRITYTSKLNDSNNYNEWQSLRQGDPYSQPEDSLWEKLRASLVTFDGMQNDVPDYSLIALRKYGNFIRPRQTWFIDRIAASKLFVDTANNLFANMPIPLVDNSNTILWIDYFTAEEPIPPVTNYDYHVTDLGQRDALIGAIAVGQKVLVDAVSATDNLWTLWEYSLGADPWILVQRQYYKVSNYWTYVDWYISGFDAQTFVSKTVGTILELEQLSGMSTGTIVKVLNNGNNKWQLYYFNGTLWILVGQQDGSIKILPSIYDWAGDFGGFDGLPFDFDPMDLIAGIEFGYMIDGIKNAIFADPNSVEINSLFFTMIEYVLSEQQQVDWIIKTSNISLQGFNQPLYPYKLLPVDLTDSITGYIEEAKPYHVKISELLIGKTYQDTARVSVVDFDYPPNFNPTPPVNDGSLAWYIWNSTYQSWLKNYQTNAQLIRTLKTTLVFDRIATPGQRLGWGSVWDTYGFNQENQSLSYGAIDRIDQYYEPSKGMIPKIISELMVGVDFRSTVLNSLGMNIDTGWSVAPWDSLIGWEPNAEIITNYLDLIVQGGQIPKYDTAIGNGITTEFLILQNPMNPLNIVVWSDGAIRKYGTEWYVPTHALKASVIQGGVNYQIGDQLDIVAGSGLAPTRIQVTGTDHGSITDVVILGTGSYTTVTAGPYEMVYPINHPGVGHDALIAIEWSCESIIFYTPPASSDKPNVYILYAGTTFEPAPTDETDTIYSGSNFVIPHVDADHPEELYPLHISDSMRIDTYVKSVGGRPLVNTRVYLTDGFKEQFDIGLKPENNVSIFVYLDGVSLKEGLGNDYVINFSTNRVVFISAPPPGILRITAISAGGGSRSVKNVYNETPGTGYSPGDFITLAGGVGTSAQISVTGVAPASATISNPGEGYNVNDSITLNGGTLYTIGENPGGFVVTSVKVVDVSPQFGGSNYLVNDLIYLDGPGYVTPVVLRVENVGVNGTVTNLTIINAGEYSFPNAPTAAIAPDNQTGNGIGIIIKATWGVKSVGSSTNTVYSVIPTNPVSTNSIGTGATLDVSWSAAHATVIEPGLYIQLPTQPVEQSSVLPNNGTGAKWNLEYTQRLNRYEYLGNGVTTDFSVPGVTVSYPAGIYITVDGETASYSRLTDGVRLTVAPPINAIVNITTFENSQFSIIEETSIDIVNPAVLEYTLTNAFPAHTMPYFSTTLVRKNGNRMEPPVIQTWIGDGQLEYYEIKVDIFSGIVTSINVYVDSVLQTAGVDYNITGESLLFTYGPAKDSEIVLVCLKNTTQYQLVYSGGITKIDFIPGSIDVNDNILVTTFTEDADYNFVTEEFFVGGWDNNLWDIYGWDGNGLEYTLVATPYDFMTISVWANNILLTPVYDYIVENRTTTTGWNVEAWDLTSWDQLTETKTVVKLGDHIVLSNDIPVTITYMLGLPERPAVAWRTLISASDTVSTAIDDNRKCTVLSNVFVSSTTIEISDVTKVSSPTANSMQYVWINDELIGYYEVQQAPTFNYPNRGFLTNLVRNCSCTSGDPRDRYAVSFYNGNGSQVYFATEPVGEAIAETVWVDNEILRNNIDYTIELNPPLLPAGRYAKLATPPKSGYKNVKITSLNANSFDTTVSHVTGTTVIDAGNYVRLPSGYMWEPTQYGIQYNKSSLSDFLLNHAGTRS